MRKDPTAFKQRFEAYKNGKSVKEIYDAGLPKYEDGRESDLSASVGIGALPFVGYDFHAAQKAARLFVLSYLLSSGFHERFNRTRLTLFKQYAGSEYDTSPLYDAGYDYDAKFAGFPLKLIVYKKNDKRWLNNGFYNWEDTIFVGPHKNGDFDDTISHELGHVVDYSLVTNTGTPYSEMLPLLRKNKQYQRKLKQLEKEADEWYVNKWKTEPMLFDYNMYHDAMPEESYGDLMSTRYWLYKNGIFDSRKSNNTFTDDHYKKILQSKEKLPLSVKRFFENFTKDDYIKAINDIAFINNSRKLSPRQEYV